MDIKLNDLEVTHYPAENRFETWIDGELSKLDYMQDGDTIVMTHVGVNPAHRGYGVHLARGGFRAGSKLPRWPASPDFGSH